MGGFIHQQDCTLLSGVVRKEGLDPMLEDQEKRAILNFLLTQYISSTPARAVYLKCIHSFISLICSTYLLCATYYAKHRGGNDEEYKTRISFSALVKIFHRLSIFFRIKKFTSLPTIPGS